MNRGTGFITPTLAGHQPARVGLPAARCFFLRSLTARSGASLGTMTDANRLQARPRMAGPQAAVPQAQPARPAARGAVPVAEYPIVCRGCGALARTSAGRAPCLGRAACPEPAAGTGFTIDEAEVTFWGLCPRCRTAAGRLPAARAAGIPVLVPQPEQVITEHLLHPAVEVHDQP
jgi:hypothetical protein